MKEMNEAESRPNDSSRSQSQHDLSIVQVAHGVSPSCRNSRYGHSGGIVWLTGLPASGKSTLAMQLEARLFDLGYACYTLDGDNIRAGLNANLGFSKSDRSENIRRAGEVAALFADAGLICIASFISPYQADRTQARTAAGQSAFHEVHLAADLATCEARDPKGMYKKARKGELRNFTGIDAPFEAPVRPDLVLHTDRESVTESVDKLVAYICEQHPMRISPVAR